MSSRSLAASLVVAVPIALVSWNLPHGLGLRQALALLVVLASAGMVGYIALARLIGLDEPWIVARTLLSLAASSPAGSQVSADRPLRIMYPASLTPGGAERQMLLLTEHLPRDRFDVSFVLLGGMTEMAREAARLGATVHALGAPRRAGQPMPVFATKVARRVASYVALCRRERYDIVDAWLYLGYGLAAVTRPISRVPVLIAGRRSLSAFKTDFGPVDRTVDAIARRSADLIVANSRAVADDVIRREGVDPARIRVIRNGVVVPPPPDETRRRAARGGTRCTAPTVRWSVASGTFKRGKGQDRVVAVMADLVRRRPDAWLVFVGDGPERAAVERQAREAGLKRVRFLGIVPDARTLYDGFDVVVSASDAEGLPERAARGRRGGAADRRDRRRWDAPRSSIDGRDRPARAGRRCRRPRTGPWATRRRPGAGRAPRWRRPRARRADVRARAVRGRDGGPVPGDGATT